jgi:hypothetical protein
MADRRLQRPWHGASDRAEEPAVALLRLQRAEVDARLAFRHAVTEEAACLAWWRLQQARRARMAVEAPDAAPSLPALPPAPPGALGWWHGVLLRLGRFRPERARPPRRLARRL